MWDVLVYDLSHLGYVILSSLQHKRMQLMEITAGTQMCCFPGISLSCALANIMTEVILSTLSIDMYELNFRKEFFLN